jgi:REP element-mobilizing transposase RayT
MSFGIVCEADRMDNRLKVACMAIADTPLCVKHTKVVRYWYDQVATQLTEFLKKIAISIDCSIEILEVMPDHVHVFIKSSPIHSPHYILDVSANKLLRNILIMIRK